MSEYEKLTVIKLREELVNRGLPKTGLKAALVQRLVEADAQSGGANAASEPAVDHPPNDVQEDLPVTREIIVPIPTEDEVQEGKKPQASEDALQNTQAGIEVTEDANEAGKDITPSETANGAQEQSSIQEQAGSAGRPEQALDNSLDATSETPTKGIIIEQDSQSEILPGTITRSAGSKEPESSVQLPTPNITRPEQPQIQDSSLSLSTQASIAGEEILEDSRKRKRRSQSPPPSSTDTQKRLKSKANPRVELPEDIPMSDAEQVVKSYPDPTQAKEDQINGHSGTGREGTPSIDQDTGENATPTPKGAARLEGGPDSEESINTPKPGKSAESLVKTSPSDTRFKNLFNGPSKNEPSASQPLYSDAKDRVVSPALHPATSALYIRELMRPLKPETVKDYLTTLATPLDAPIESSIITEFFLDSIRTHCLVGFANISAASRVRSGLHDRIWPNERDRRPLFVDFVPEEKLKKWIDVEQNAPSGRGQPSKRWEIVYEDENGEIKAYLQEVGSRSGGLRAAKPAMMEAGSGIQGAPSGPRVRESERPSVQQRVDNGKGFQALDDLFRSTAAKPKLYYQPVPKAQAERRLAKLAAGRGGGRNDEMRRFSFEDEIIVDKGPEFGNRGRAGYGSRGGGYQGGHQGRGGGYRGDGYRGGDSWRGRR